MTYAIVPDPQNAVARHPRRPATHHRALADALAMVTAVVAVALLLAVLTAPLVVSSVFVGVAAVAAVADRVVPLATGGRHGRSPSPAPAGR